MSVYKKLNDARMRLQGIKIKASGKNTFAGYEYIELGDILPHINNIFNDVGLCGIVRFSDIDATLSVVNVEKSDEIIVFTSPMSTASLKGCHDVQNLGAVQTYLRRYLYVMALEVVEHDALDSTHGKESKEAGKAASGKQETGSDAEYIDRIKTALKTLYGDNKAAALSKVEELTSFVPKGKTEAERVKGVRDFTKLTGTRLQILAHNLEKLAAAFDREPGAEG